MTNLFTDTFTAANETLATYGNGWVIDTAGVNSDWTITSNALQYLRTDSTVGLVHNPANIGSTTDYKVHADILSQPSTGNHGITGRQTDASNYYLYLTNSTTNVDLYKQVAGSFTNLGSATVTTATAWLSMQGTAIKTSHNGGTTVDISVVDSSLASAGSAGFREAPDTNNTTQCQWNNFTVDDFNAGGPIIQMMTVADQSFSGVCA